MGRKRSRGVYNSRQRFGKKGEAVTVIDPLPDQAAGKNATHAHALGDEIAASRDLEAAVELGLHHGAKRIKRDTRKEADDGDSDAEADKGIEFDIKETEKILKVAREQREEVRREEEGEKEGLDVGKRSRGRGESEEEDSMDDENELDNMELERRFGHLDAAEITEDDEAALALFGDETVPRMNLADIVLEKIREKETMTAVKREVENNPEKAERERKIRETYTAVGHILSKYRSGKVPKAFKIIPKFSNWKDILALTRPDGWSPAAMFVGTRLFASNLKPKEARYFYREYLLPSVIQDIEENSKLNFHLYQALRKATFKPEAFNKGILFPLCESRRTTLRQATIIGSVIAKQSIPMLHSAAALLNITKLPYTGANSLFIRVLLDKKYALPYRVIDALVDHFYRMIDEHRKLPVIWHSCLLSFAQHYKREIEVSQKEMLKRLMRVQFHPQITSVIRTELFSVRSRGESIDPDPDEQARAIAAAG